MGWEARSESRWNACCTPSACDNVNGDLEKVLYLESCVQQIETRHSSLYRLIRSCNTVVYQDSRLTGVEMIDSQPTDPCCKAFIKPKLIPPVHGHEVTKPLVSQFFIRDASDGNVRG